MSERRDQPQEQPAGSERLEWQAGKQAHRYLSDNAAEAYDASYANSNFSTGLYMAYELDTIDRAVALVGAAGGTAIDLGCGTGRDTFHFYQNFDQVTGYDFSQNMITVANRNRDQHDAATVNFIQRDVDAERLAGISDVSVDFINSGFGMGSFIEDLDGLLGDVRRVLRPGGIFTISFYNSDALVNQVEELDWTPSLSARVDREKGSLHVNFNGNEYDIAARPYSMQEAKELLGKHLTVEELSSFPTLSSLLPNKLFNNPKIRELARLVDYDIRFNESVGGGPYITAICRKAV